MTQPSLAAARVSRPQHRGANLAGGGTYYLSWGASGPVKDTHYRFVEPSTVDKLIAVAGPGRTFRVLFTWEALQPTEYADIASLSGNYAVYRDQLFALVNRLLSVGCEVLLDVHGDNDNGFTAYRGVKVGNAMPSGHLVEDMLENLWWQLAGIFKSSTRVHYGITNEPHDIPARAWFGCAQKVIGGIRRAGGRGKIVAPGVDWTGASSWMKQNAAAWNLVDPLNNLAAQVHLYFDRDAGGGALDVGSDTVGVERLRDVTAWARLKNVELWIAETGLSASSAHASAAFANTMAFVKANQDVFGGVLWWAQGPIAPHWWGGYQFTLFDGAGNPSPQLNLAKSTLFAP